MLNVHIYLFEKEVKFASVLSRKKNASWPAEKQGTDYIPHSKGRLKTILEFSLIQKRVHVRTF